MRIAIVTEIYLPYTCGIATNTALLAEKLIALGHQVLIVTSDLKSREFHIQGSILKCPAKPAKNQYGFAVASSSSAELFETLEKFKPEILHLHTASSIGQAAIKFSGLHDLPMVFTIHENFDNQSAYTNSRFMEPIAKMSAKNLFKDCVDNADMITSASKRASAYLSACKISRKLDIVPNNTDAKIFDYAKVSSVAIQQVRRIANLPSDKTVALFAGRLTLDKSVEILLENWAAQIKSTNDLHLLIAGTGPEAEPLADWAKDLGISKQVTFAGEVSHDKMPAYYAACNMFVSASQSDLMSQAALEAIACGVPCIVPHIPGGNEEIKEGINGFTYHNAQEFGKFVKQIASLDAEGRRILKKVVRRSIESTPSTQQAAQMLDIYNNAIQSHYYNPDGHRKA